ncbi:MAG: U32 family peptidase [Candidatus Omnitrophica bacterium]|nr:U32 family peptidase [Candidatus Omnitrophota bacterium]
MKLTVPTNWDDALIERIKKTDVGTLYGKLYTDIVGGGRPSFILPKIKKRKAKAHIENIHKAQLQFYYLLNASCMGNREWTRSGQKKLDALLKTLSEFNIDGVVIALPYLLQYIKKRYPHLKVSVSCFANVNSVEKAKWWDSLGVSTITLSQVEVTRNFKLLEQIRKHVHCELQLLANDHCIHDCPLFYYHNNATSHSSCSNDSSAHFMFDYCRLLCRSRRIANKAMFIRSNWIRPEDIRLYENVGIDSIKLVDRTMSTDALTLIINAYADRSYKGNLYDLLGSPSKSLWLKKSNFISKLLYFFRPHKINIFKLWRYRNIIKDIDVYIDNTKLEGFIDRFFTEDCRYKSCDDCGYCQKIADEVITINTDFQEEVLKGYYAFIDEIESGKIFNYLH